MSSIQQTTNGNYILGGSSKSNSNANGGKSQNSKGRWDYWILKIGYIELFP